MKKLIAMIMMMFAFATSSFAEATDFATALPTSMTPDGFWAGVALVLGFTVTMVVIYRFMNLSKRS